MQWFDDLIYRAPVGVSTIVRSYIASTIRSSKPRSDDSISSMTLSMTARRRLICSAASQHAFFGHLSTAAKAAVQIVEFAFGPATEDVPIVGDNVLDDRVRGPIEKSLSQ